MTVESEAGYDPVVVYDYLVSHGRQRSDRRFRWFCTLNGQQLSETHRDTLDRWFGDPWWPRVPLDRWDEILLDYGVMLYEFEAWATEAHGWTGFCSSDEV